MSTDKDDKHYYFDLLREIFEKHNISEVEVKYEGSGDSGSSRVEQVTLMDGTVCTVQDSDSEFDFPDDTPVLDITLKNQHYEMTKWDDATSAWLQSSATRDISFNDFILEVADHFIDLNHGGWENNEGGYGKVTFKRERNGIAALADSDRQRIYVSNYHADYIQHVEEYEHEYVSDKPET
jgi:hypothetical protein